MTSTPAEAIAEIEAIIGYTFREPVLLLQALTHSSRISERTPDDPLEDNEKLEFLGDAVLELLVSEELVRTFPHWKEGQLSKSRARLVSASALSMAAKELGLGKHLLLGRGEDKTGGRSKPAILADAFEAVIAAIYMDGGLIPARNFVQRTLIAGALATEAEHLGRSDHKSALQEFLQARGMAPGSYHLVEETGPDHAKTFCVEVRIPANSIAGLDGEVLGEASNDVTGTGHGKTKKEAEQLAAVSALAQLDSGVVGRIRKDG